MIINLLPALAILITAYFILLAKIKALNNFTSRRHQKILLHVSSILLIGRVTMKYLYNLFYFYF